MRWMAWRRRRAAGWSTRAPPPPVRAGCRGPPHRPRAPPPRPGASPSLARPRPAGAALVAVDGLLWTRFEEFIDLTWGKRLLDLRPLPAIPGLSPLRRL